MKTCAEISKEATPEVTKEERIPENLCWRCILVHLACSLHFGLDLIIELTRH
jgi:hypothetical protein